MSSEAFGVTIFCDDIRHEVNGKITLVGCYSGEMNFIGHPPGVIPNFAALINIRIPKNIKFNQIRLRVIKEEGEESTEMLDATIESAEPDVKKVIDSEAEADDGQKLLAITMPSQWAPFSMKSAGFIKVRALIDQELEVRLGALKVNFQEVDQAETP